MPAFFRQGGGQAEPLNYRGPQFPHAKRNVLVELSRQVLQCSNLRVELGTFDGEGFERFQRQTQRRHLLPQLIVQVAGNPPPFVFLCQNKTGEQLSLLFLRALPVLDFNAERLIDP